MYFSSASVLVTTVVACLASTSTAFVAGGGSALRSSLGRTTFSSEHVQFSARQQQPRPRPVGGLQSLRASAEDEEGGGGFKNPYNAFRQWQMDLIESKAKSSDKYPEAYEGLMKEPGMTKQKAERLAKLSVSDPILYAIERRREANEINDTPMDYSKISGFFPMEWIMTGDFGWGFNKKKARLAEEAKEEAARNGRK